MTIQILPARLANQIAAGEVVERPASVIKELVENSLDAGATKIVIDIEKGGAKKIRIADNGCGIDKEELSLALSRHATSKIKDLSDLEAIASLGFRGEALASISSVARLTLTSKPAEQENAWQASAQGRDMEVTVKPAAHPNGTTIEVNDLFFNTPARRKFLRTEKTEFSHIDEVIRRIALARFDVSFTLTHNGKAVRQYRGAKNDSQYVKRVASICGQKFVDSSIEIECQHGDLRLWGWIAKPDYTRPTNDMCYSYVNGRMMRDKLINHAIRQAYSDLITADGYPAFVLFLELDHKEVDVNVHPAKHEVRFHQGRYIHDFIFSVCHQAIQQAITESIAQQDVFASEVPHQDETAEHAIFNQAISQQLSPEYTGTSRASEPRSYVKPLNFNSGSSRQQEKYDSSAGAAYQQLMTPHQNYVNESAISTPNTRASAGVKYSVLHIVNQQYALISDNNELRLLALSQLAQQVNHKNMIQRWQQGIVSQPLLLPVVVKLSADVKSILLEHLTLFEKSGIEIHMLSGGKVQIRQFPAMLRDKDIGTCFENILAHLVQHTENVTESTMIDVLVVQMMAEQYTIELAVQLLSNAATVLNEQLNETIRLNSVIVDLTSQLSQFN